MAASPATLLALVATTANAAIARGAQPVELKLRHVDAVITAAAVTASLEAEMLAAAVTTAPVATARQLKALVAAAVATDVSAPLLAKAQAAPVAITANVLLLPKLADARRAPSPKDRYLSVYESTLLNSKDNRILEILIIMFYNRLKSTLYHYD